MSMHYTSINDDFIDMSWYNDNRFWKQRFWIFNDRQTKSQNWFWWWNRFCDKTWFATSKINDIQKNEISINDRTDEIVWNYSNDQVFQNFFEFASKSDEVKRIYECQTIARILHIENAASISHSRFSYTSSWDHVDIFFDSAKSQESCALVYLVVDVDVNCVIVITMSSTGSRRSCQCDTLFLSSTWIKSEGPFSIHRLRTNIIILY